MSAAARARLKKAADDAGSVGRTTVDVADLYRVLHDLDERIAHEERELSLTQALRRIKEAMDSW